MSSDEELSGTINNEEIDEGDKDTEGNELSDDSMVSQETAEEIDNVQSSEPTDLPSEKPIGIEEQKVIETQERKAEHAEEPISETEEEPETTTQKEQVDEILSGSKEKQGPKKEDSTRNLFNQFAKHFQISKVASDKTTNTLKQIQKQLTQIDRTTITSNRQQALTKQLMGQVKAMQKQLDKIISSVNRIKNISDVKRKGIGKRKK